MKERKIYIKELLDYIHSYVLSVEGEIEDRYIDNIADVKHVKSTTLDWINPSKENKQALAEESLADVILVDESVVGIEGKTLIHVHDPKFVLALVGNYFFVEKPKPGIHPTAIVDNNAIIGHNVYIGPYCVIGNAVIGDDCILDSLVRVHDDVIIGNHCEVKSGAVLGGAGFGFEKDENGNKFRFPQIGRLVIGDYVEIGANTCIDRGALSDTVIGNYTKINNLCHIAHNNQIGDNVTIAGCVNLSGSNVIEDDVWIAPNSSLRGFIHLGCNSFIGTGAVVTKNVPSGETWVGNPAKKLERHK